MNVVIRVGAAVRAAADALAGAVLLRLGSAVTGPQQVVGREVKQALGV